MATVTKIPATVSRYTATPIQTRVRRKVAAYARVSTDHEDQLNSYEAQCDYYTTYIQANDEWEFAGVYSDEGISGTSTRRRDGFNRMVEDALAGRIGLILTKSVSRFARNTVDSLTTIRKLKEHGTEVYFEKENIWTFDSKGELLLTIMSSLAQEESRSISLNVTWGQRKRFADGKATAPFSVFLGYDRGENGEFVINPEQAEIVKIIYGEFLKGFSFKAIARKLTEMGIKSPKGKDVWNESTVKSILTNEKYKGCALLQKHYTADYLTKKIVRNDGVVPQYYVEDCHEAIIDPATFDRVQTLNSQALHERLPADYYDYIVIDESHHAAAQSYEKALTHFQPKILLGLTATPERMDGQDIYKYFDRRIAAEIRLPEAINRKLLCPFQYFGVSDTVDLNDLRWVRGGYDRAELSNLYTLSQGVAEKRADHILRSMDRYVTDMNDVRALGFCVSIEHARFMADYFNRCGVPALALTGDSRDDVRASAQERLVKGDLRILFVVDIYNEGVDIPEVNTVLFLRPTESLTIFLQQLGRGLRLAEGKECLTVLDFIGAANRKYNFEEKFAALLDNTNHSVEQELRHGFVSVPKGCYIQLEKKASQIILTNIRQSYGFRAGLVSRIASFEEDSGLPLTLENFLTYHHMDVRTIYARFSFARLCAEAGVRESFAEPVEDVLTKAFSRLCAINSRRWIAFLLDILPRLDDVDFSALGENEKRMLNMFYVTVWQEVIDDFSSDDVWERLYALADSPVMLGELIELLKYKLNTIDFIDAPADLPYDCPLDVHCSYTRDQLLLALDFMKPKTLREGVKWLNDKQTDVLLITLNKSDKEYSPTTMYNDYSINSRLFHWQSQSTTSADSPTGQRYIHHKARGSHVLLFVRETKSDACGTAPYTFLGTADYVSHTGSRPMNIVWQLHQEIPAKFLRKTQQVVG